MLTMFYQILSHQSQRNSQPPKLWQYALNRFGIGLLPSHINPSLPYEILNLVFDEPIQLSMQDCILHQKPMPLSIAFTPSILLLRKS